MTETRQSSVSVYCTETRKWILRNGVARGEGKLTLFVDFPDRDTEQFHFDLIELDPIYDDKGKCVFPGSDKDTLKEQWRIYGSPLVSDDYFGDGKRGPLLDMSVKAPERGAISLRKVKGVVGVGGGAWNLLHVPLAVLRTGKPLEIPELVGLQLTPAVQKVEGGTLITMSITGELSRLHHWSLGSQDYKPQEAKEIPGGREDNYLVERAKANTIAEFRVFTPRYRYLFPFDIEDVALP